MNSQGQISPGTAAEKRSCPWLNIWVFLIFALPIKAAFVTICLVALLDGSYGPYKTLVQNSTEWYCVPSSSAQKVDGWMCCPKGWRRFQRSCYFLSLDRMNCAASAQNCTGMGSQLVVITSKAEQEFLFKQKTPPTRRDNIYIGLLKDKLGQWQWVDKTPYKGTPTFWRKGEPSDILGEICTVMHVPERNLSNWNNVNPDTLNHRICEAAAVIV